MSDYMNTASVKNRQKYWIKKSVAKRSRARFGTWPSIPGEHVKGRTNLHKRGPHLWGWIRYGKEKFQSDARALGMLRDRGYKRTRSRHETHRNGDQLAWLKEVGIRKWEIRYYQLAE